MEWGCTKIQGSKSRERGLRNAPDFFSDPRCSVLSRTTTIIRFQSSGGVWWQKTQVLLRLLLHCVRSEWEYSMGLASLDLRLLFPSQCTFSPCALCCYNQLGRRESSSWLCLHPRLASAIWLSLTKECLLCASQQMLFILSYRQKSYLPMIKRRSGSARALWRTIHHPRQASSNSRR